MSWHARLQLDYRLEAGRCVARHEHQGPLRILHSLYPEHPGVCHNVLVHPPGGLVGGDHLEISIRVGSGAHGLVTTPGASRFYRSEGEVASQHTSLALEAGARFEWLPLEALCYSGCLAENRLHMELAPEAELMGWDVVALGLPESDQPFASGSLLQHMELQGAWLERGRVAAANHRLMDSPLGLAGHRCLATLFLASGSAFTRERRESALDLARQTIHNHGLGDLAGLPLIAGATAPGPQVVAVRVLAPLVEPALALLKAVRQAWRPGMWGLPAHQPRGWAL